MRLARQQEAQDRQWREKELRKAQSKAKREEEIRMIRDEQIRQRREMAAKSVEREKNHWEQKYKEWQEDTSKETEVVVKKAKVWHINILTSNTYTTYYFFLSEKTRLSERPPTAN